MAEDTIDQAATLGDLPEKPCVTRSLNIHVYHSNASQFGALAFYGTDAPAINALIAADPALGQKLDAALPYVAAEVVWAARKEMARTVEDVLARRTRALFLNAKAAMRMAPRVAELLAKELNHDTAWRAQQIAAFAEVARGYQVAL
jgi:glycerol-3-phosphate dehydrogenase